MPGAKRLLKILLIIVGIILVLIIAGYLAISSFLNPTYLRNLVTKIASESLQRPVEIGSVSLKLGFKIGVKIDQLSIGNLPGFSPEPMVQIENTALNFKLLPLLRRQIVIGSIDIHKLNLNIERNKDNQINFVAPISKESKGTNWQLSLDGINIIRSNIRYIDAIANLEIQVRELNQHISFERNLVKISGNQAVYFLKSKTLPEMIVKVNNNIVYDTLKKNLEIQKLIVSYEPISLNISGIIEKMENFNIQVNLDIEDLSKIIPLIPQNYRPDRLNGALVTNISILGTTKEPKLNGKCEIKNVVVKPKGANREIEKLSVNFIFDQNSVRNIIVMGMLGGTKFDMSGDIDNLKNPVLSLNLKVSGNLNDLESLTEEMKGVKLSGPMSLNIALKGHLDKPTIFGDYYIAGANIDGIGLEKPITNLVIKGTIQNDAAKISRGSGHIGSSDFSFSGHITNFKEPIIQINNTSNLIDLDELLPKSKEKKSEQKKGIPITIQGSVKINRIVGMDMEFKNITTNFVFDKGIIDLKNCNADAFDGKVQFDFYYDSKSPEPYRIHTKMNNISAQKILKRFLKFENLEAKITGISNFQGKGFDQSQIKNNLTAVGNLKLANGVFKNFPFLISLFDWLGLKDYKNITFNDYICNFRIENGKTKVEDWSISSTIGNFLINGTVGLDGVINLNITLTLNKKESDLLKKYHGDWLLYYDKNGQATVDIIASGKVLSPQFKLDTAKISDRLKGKIKDEFDKKKKELEKKLKDLLKK
ncbi:MAG: AsmA family protein [candidate division WOR-3 bacterium]